MVLFLSNKRYCSKTLLFFIIGSLVYMSGYREYKYLYGWQREPFFGVAFIVMIFAIGGVPPFSGFLVKCLFSKVRFKMVIISD